MNQCSKKEIREKARKIVDLEEDVDDLISLKEERGLTANENDSLSSKMNRIDLFKKDIASCGFDPKVAIIEAENELDDD